MNLNWTNSPNQSLIISFPNLSVAYWLEGVKTSIQTWSKVCLPTFLDKWFNLPIREICLDLVVFALCLKSELCVFFAVVVATICTMNTIILEQCVWGINHTHCKKEKREPLVTKSHKMKIPSHPWKQSQIFNQTLTKKRKQNKKKKSFLSYPDYFNHLLKMLLRFSVEHNIQHSQLFIFFHKGKLPSVFPIFSLSYHTFLSAF